MMKFFLPSFSICLLCLYSFAQEINVPDGLKWQQLKNADDAASFRSACDLMQRIGKTNLKQSYKMLAEYVPIVKRSGHSDRVHILLMGWARAKESTGYFDEAESLYRDVLKNTNPQDRYYREAMVAMVLMYAEWGKMDSVNKYLQTGEQACKTANDKENLSFLYGFRAMTHSEDTAAMRYYFEKAMELGAEVPDKNALFTARYNYAYMYCQNNLLKQVTEFEALLDLAKDSSLNHYPRKLYERTAFTFRNAGPSIYYNLMQVNFLLTDFDNAWKFAELFYDATIKPNPASINAPYFNAEMAIAKAYQGDYLKAKVFLDTSRQQFALPEDSIPYLSYFIAAGMLAEHAANYTRALHYYSIALKKGNTQSQHLIPPEIYYARALIHTNQLNEAAGILAKFDLLKDVRRYSAVGLNYYKCYSELLKAKNDYTAYTQALETYYTIKDSLANLNRYRAIEEIEATVRVRDKEQQITRLNAENAAREKQLRKERIFYLVIISFAILAIILLILFLRNRQLRHKQQQALRNSQLKQMEKQHRIEIMQGAIDAEENERKKIADQLHDDVNAMLALASLNISSSLEQNNYDEAMKNKIRKSHEILTSVSSTIRNLSHRLTPLVIEKYGFRNAIEDLARSVNVAEKIKLETVIIGFEKTEKYPSSFLNDIYRIVQELLHNIVKHAHASHAIIELVEHEKQVSIMVEDDGVGIEQDAIGKGKGLVTIRSRVAYLNGIIEITGKKETGSLTIIEIPC